MDINSKRFELELQFAAEKSMNVEQKIRLIEYLLKEIERECMKKIIQITNKKRAAATTTTQKLNYFYLIMTQISQKSKALVDWNSAKVFAKLLSNENCLWTIFPPKKEGGRCYHFPTETNFERKVEECLKNNPKHSLGLIVNPTVDKPADYGKRKEDISSMVM